MLILDAYWFRESELVFFADNDFIEHLGSGFAEIAQLGAKKIILVGQIPTWTLALPDILARKYRLRRPTCHLRINL